MLMVRHKVFLNSNQTVLKRVHSKHVPRRDGSTDDSQVLSKCRRGASGQGPVPWHRGHCSQSWHTVRRENPEGGRGGGRASCVCPLSPGATPGERDPRRAGGGSVWPGDCVPSIAIKSPPALLCPQLLHSSFSFGSMSPSWAAYLGG